MEPEPISSLQHCSILHRDEHHHLQPFQLMGCLVFCISHILNRCPHQPSSAVPLKKHRHLREWSAAQQGEMKLKIMQTMVLFLSLIHALYWHCSFCFAKLDERGKCYVRKICCKHYPFKLTLLLSYVSTIKTWNHYLFAVLWTWCCVLSPGICCIHKLNSYL